VQLEYRLVSLLRHKEGLEWLESLWLSESAFQEAFMGLCSILTRGKDLCSPTKRHKRKANEKFFASLSGINSDSPKTKGRLVSGEYSTKVLRLAKGMAEQSDRWSKMMPDEILSVTLLMDTKCHGSITWAEFYNFCHHVDAALVSQSGKNTPQKAMSDLYTNLLSEKQAALTSRFVTHVGDAVDEKTMSRLTVQLIKLAIYARLNDMNPLTLLVNLKVFEKQQERKRAKERDGAAATAATSGAAGTATGSPGSAFALIPTESRDSMPLDALVSLLMHLGAEITGEGSANVLQAKQMFQKSLEESSRGCRTTSNNENMSNISNISGVGAENSFVLHTPAREGDLDNLDSSIALLRENASAISARLTATGQSVEAATSIWTALQSLETELNKASSSSSANSSPRTPGTPYMSGDASMSKQSLSGRPFPISLFASPNHAPLSPRAVSSGVVLNDNTIDIASEAHASVLLNSSRNSSITGDSSKARVSHIATLATLRTNLSIFKSPASRRHTAANPNMYSEETMSWESDKSKLSNVYNERFQSTNQVTDAKKIFRILGEI